LIDHIRKIADAVLRESNGLELAVIDVCHWRPENPNDMYFTGETVSEAYLRTVVADIKYEGLLPVFHGNLMNPTSLKPVKYANQNVCAIMHACEGRIFAPTEYGLVGLVPENARAGDQIYLLLGGQVLYELRPVGDHFRVIGECYIHGHMDGDILKVVSLGLRRFRTIEIHYRRVQKSVGNHVIDPRVPHNYDTSWFSLAYKPNYLTVRVDYDSWLSPYR
jgi:hypothetical protein